jgi:uncharacterized OB-fold protein
MIDGKPTSAAPEASFNAYLKAGEFRLQRCGGCGKQIFFPRTICPYCGSNELHWQPTSGRGVVYSTTTVRQRPERGGDYNIALIDLEEGARMLSRVEGKVPTEVKIGMRVEAVISEAGGSPLVTFRAVGEL